MEEKELKHELVAVDVMIPNKQDIDDEFLIGAIMEDAFAAEFLEEELEDGKKHLWYAVKSDFVRNENDFINSIKMIAENIEVGIYRIPR